MEKVKLPDYEHIHCRCGGVLGSKTGDVDDIRCDRCNKVYPIWKLNFDAMYVNDKTGWVFPVRYRNGAK